MGRFLAARLPLCRAVPCQSGQKTFFRTDSPTRCTVRCSEQSRRKAVTQSHGATAHWRHARRAASDDAHRSQVRRWRPPASQNHQGSELSMTYCHLIARRTALLRGAAVLAVALVAACADGPASPDDASQVLAARPGKTGPSSSSSATQLMATSEHPVIAPADTTVLVATAVDADGTRRTLNAQWSSLDGGTLKRHNNRQRHAMLF